MEAETGIRLQVKGYQGSRDKVWKLKEAGKESLSGSPERTSPDDISISDLWSPERGQNTSLLC